MEPAVAHMAQGKPYEYSAATMHNFEEGDKRRMDELGEALEASAHRFSKEGLASVRKIIKKHCRSSAATAHKSKRGASPPVQSSKKWWRFWNPFPDTPWDWNTSPRIVKKGHYWLKEGLSAACARISPFWGETMKGHVRTKPKEQAKLHKKGW